MSEAQQHDMHGHVAAGYEAVADAFAENFRTRRDGGSAFAVRVAGEVVVDLWAGVADADTGRVWDGDTVCVMFSGSKGIVATALAMLVASGRLDVDLPVAHYWPEFAAGGKHDITVAALAAHAAGLPGVEERLGTDALADPRRIAALLAGQTPMVPVGSPCYHALTFGWLCGELVRRVDARGRSIGAFVREEIARPRGLDVRIGCTDDELADVVARRARLSPAPDYQLGAFLAAAPDPRLKVVYGNPNRHLTTYDEPEVMRLEIPAGNAVGSARGMAGLYAALIDDAAPLVPSVVLARATVAAAVGDDPLTGRPLRFGPTGFELAGTPSALGPAADAFGHTGAGGSSHGAWPSLRVAWSYSTNVLRPETADGRAAALLDALHACTGGAGAAVRDE